MRAEVLRLTHNYIWPFYNPEKSNVKASINELTLINNFIIPRLKQMKNVMVKGSGEIIKDKIKCFHSKDILNIEISSDIYEIILEKLQLTYLHFAEEIA